MDNKYTVLQKDFLFNFQQINNIKSRKREFELIFFLLKKYNFRISEILNLNLKSLVNPDYVIVKLSKSKNYFVINDEELKNLLFSIFSRNLNNSFSVDYPEFYRWFKSYKPSFVIQEKNKNAKVTHSFRYKNAQLFSDCNRTESEIKALLRHASKKTQNYYIKKKKIKINLQ